MNRFAVTIAVALACACSTPAPIAGGSVPASDVVAGPGLADTASSSDVVPDSKVDDAAVPDAAAVQPLTSPLPLDPSLMARAAVVVASCMPDDSPARRLDGFYTPSTIWFERFSTAAACLATKNTGCQALLDCIGASTDVATAGCAAGCTGEVLSVCDKSTKQSVDCSKIGLHCLSGAGAKPECGAAAPSKTCSFATFQATCADGRPHVCADTMDVGPECAKFATQCVTMDFGAQCQGADGACAMDITGSLDIIVRGMACENGKLRACMNGGSGLLDCGLIGKGMTCQESAGNAFCGIANECVPDPAAKSTCDGKQVVLCNAGKLEKVDCAELGFSDCLPKYGVCSPGPYDFAK